MTPSEDQKQRERIIELINAHKHIEEELKLRYGDSHE